MTGYTTKQTGYSLHPLQLHYFGDNHRCYQKPLGDQMTGFAMKFI